MMVLVAWERQIRMIPRRHSAGHRTDVIISPEQQSGEFDYTERAD